MQWRWIFPVVALAWVPLSWSAEVESRYAGQEKREIKALSEQEVQGYLSGSGMGFAKTAELNHYPGPRHVLDLAESLQLSQEQRRLTQAIFDRMKAEAVRLGQELLSRERELETLFNEGTISRAALDQLVAEIAEVRGELRAVHLRAHLAQKPILTQHQLGLYDVLRGYDGSSHSAHARRNH